MWYVLYLIGALVAASFNVSEWHWILRSVVGVGWLVSVFLALVDEGLYS